MVGQKSQKRGSIARYMVEFNSPVVGVIRSLRDDKVLDSPPQPVQRYHVQRIAAAHTVWRFNHKVKHLVQGTNLRIQLCAAARVRWSSSNWEPSADCETSNLEPCFYFVDSVGSKVAFTFFWLDATKWEGTNWEMVVAAKIV